MSSGSWWGTAAPGLGSGSGRFLRVKTSAPQTRKEDPPTYAGGDGGAALLVALGAAVAGDAGDTVLAGTLARGLVAGLAGGTHGVTVALCGNTDIRVRAGHGWRCGGAAPPARLHLLCRWLCTSGKAPE